jgi:hypothetical protein
MVLEFANSLNEAEATAHSTTWYREHKNFKKIEQKQQTVHIRVARWFILRPKIPIRVDFGGPWNGQCW